MTAGTYDSASDTTFTEVIDNMVDWGYLKAGITRSSLYIDEDTELTKQANVDEVEVCFEVKSNEYKAGLGVGELYCQ